MKIVSWNVSFGNRHLESQISNIFKKDPDIVCLQEFPKNKLNILDLYPQYKYFYTFDAKFPKTIDDGMLILTAVKDTKKVKNFQVFTYINKEFSSLLNMFYYKYFSKIEELNDALIVKLENNQKIVNFRLSTATGPLNRELMLKNILLSCKKSKNVLCGDFNTANNVIFRVLTGAIRGYKLKEFFVDEYKNINKLLSGYGYQNPFFNTKTLSCIFLPKMQLDYIVIPKESKKYKTKIEKRQTGSDHRIITLVT